MLALIIGCDYEGTRDELSGCSKDVLDMDTYLSKNGFKTEILCDDDDRKIKKVVAKPTRYNIMNYFRKLCIRSPPKMFIHYSGHGYYTNNIGNRDSELDGRDELLISTDNKPIRDDEINRMLTRVRKNRRVFLLIDACHSGTVSDLKYLLVNSKETMNNKNDEIRADIVSISGCRDDQTSADAFLGNSFRGAMTTAFLFVLSKTNNGDITLVNFIKLMRKWLKRNKFTQVPQLCFSRQGAYNNKLSDYL
jgi:hypothetical protein